MTTQFVDKTDTVSNSELIEPLEAERHRADALAATLLELRDVVTHDHETKAAFITRIKRVLGADPDDRLAALLAELADRDNPIGNVQLPTECEMCVYPKPPAIYSVSDRLPLEDQEIMTCGRIRGGFGDIPKWFTNSYNNGEFATYHESVQYWFILPDIPDDVKFKSP